MKINRILALLALVGGLTAAFTAFPEKNGLYPDWRTEKARIEGHRVHFISAPYLAERMYRKDKLVLLDVRDREQFESYHLPRAMHVHAEESEVDPGGGPFVLYGKHTESIPEEWLTGLKGKVYVLKGGMEAWHNQVLFPDFSQYPALSGLLGIL